MTIDVRGTFAGEQLTVSWTDGAIHATDAVLDALCECAAGMHGRTLYLANGERLKDDLFDHPSGFVAVAFATLEDASTEWEAPRLPDGELV